MPLIDERGRLLGKVNLIDAAVGLLFLFLIPLAYGAYALFRTPPPQITAMEAVTLNDQGWRVKLRGKDLRPFLQAFAGGHMGEFLIESPSRAEVQLPKLETGTYDLALYDQAKEVARLVGAVTIAPGGVLSTTTPSPTVATPPKLAPLTVQVRVRFVVKPEVFALVRVGDIDVMGSDSTEAGAVLTALEQRQSLDSQMRVEYSDGGMTIMGARDQLTAFEAILRVPVEQLSNRVLSYRAVPVRVGAPFTFGSPRYVMRGTVLQVLR